MKKILMCSWLMLFVPALSAQVKEQSMPILAWHGVQEQSVERYLELKGTGITHNFTGFSSAEELLTAMNAAHAAGIKMIASCPELAEKPEIIVERLKNHPAIAGYFLRDEPSKSDFAELGRWAKRIQAVDNEHFCYLNLLPNYATPEQLGTATYREHVKQFIEEVPLQLLSFDHYPIIVNENGERVLRGNWYENLEIFSDEARKAQRPFWAFALTAAHYSYPVPTLAELRLQVYSNLAYGAQGIQYFTYWMPESEDYHHAPIDFDTNQRTEIYDMIKQMNEEIKNLSPVFMNARVLSTGHTGKEIPEGTRRLGNLPGIINAFEAEGDAVVSVLEKGDRSFLVIVNRDFKNLLPVRVAGSSDLQRILKDGTTVPAKKYTERLFVDPGDILIYSWKTN